MCVCVWLYLFHITPNHRVRANPRPTTLNHAVQRVGIPSIKLVKPIVTNVMLSTVLRRTCSTSKPSLVRSYIGHQATRYNTIASLNATARFLLTRRTIRPTEARVRNRTLLEKEGVTGQFFDLNSSACLPQFFDRHVRPSNPRGGRMPNYAVTSVCITPCILSSSLPVKRCYAFPPNLCLSRVLSGGGMSRCRFRGWFRSGAEDASAWLVSVT